MKTIFVVDDSEINLLLIEEILKSNYSVLTMTSAEEMFERLKKLIPNLIIMDVDLKDMDGFQTIRVLRSRDPWIDIPVVFLRNNLDPEIETMAYKLGAKDFITKPFSAEGLLHRIKNVIGIDEIVQDQTIQLRELQNSIITVLSELVEKRDFKTGGHIKRTSAYIKLFCKLLAEQKLYEDLIGNWDIEKLVSSAKLHDVGKISISDTILNKPGKLTDEEFEIMKTHTTEGVKIIDDIAMLTHEGYFLTNAKLFAGQHHEKWDGSGYPYGLKGKEISLQGRLMGVIDVFDALTSDRPYKKRFSHKDSVDIILSESGKAFDPELVEIFEKNQDAFEVISITASY